MRQVPRWLLVLAGWCASLLVIGLLAWLGLRLLGRVMPVTAAVVAALLLTALLAPVERRLRRLLPGWAASLLTVVLLLAAVVGSVYLLVDQAVGQADDLRDTAVEGASEVGDWLLDSPIPVSEATLEQLPDRLNDALTQHLPSATSGATVVSEVLGSTVLALFLLFFFLKDGGRMWSWWVEHAPASGRATTERAGGAAWLVLSGYVRGTTLVALFDAIGIGIALVVMQVPLAASLTSIVFIGAFVPIVGAVVSGGLATLVALVTAGPVAALVVLGATILVQQLEGNVFQPMVMGRALDLHPVVIVLAVTVGGLLAGVMGAVVAVPLVAMARRVIDAFADPGGVPPPDDVRVAEEQDAGTTRHDSQPKSTEESESTEETA